VDGGVQNEKLAPYIIFYVVQVAWFWHASSLFFVDAAWGFSSMETLRGSWKSSDLGVLGKERFCK